MRVALVALAFGLCVGAASAATSTTSGSDWHWSSSAAVQVVNRFTWSCRDKSGNNTGRCSRSKLANADALKLRGPDRLGRGGETVSDAHCLGVGEHIYGRDERTPLYEQFVCRLSAWSLWPKETDRRFVVVMSVDGPPNLNAPDAEHHYSLRRVVSYSSKC